MARQKKPVHRVQMTEGKRNIIHQIESKRSSFRSDRYQFTVVMPKLNYDVLQNFEGNGTMSEIMSEIMSESVSELERIRMQVILHYLDTNKEINSPITAKLLKVEIKTASRLLSKAAKLDILKNYGKTKNKVYFREQCKWVVKMFPQVGEQIKRNMKKAKR